MDENPTDQKKQITLKIDESGQLVPTDLESFRAMASSFIASGFLPERYKQPNQVITAYQMAKELDIPPLTALRQIAVINGTPSLYGDLPLALCLRRKAVKRTDIDEFYIDDKYEKICLENKNLSSKAYGAICRIKTNGNYREFYFTLDDAKTAGLYPARSNSQPWAKYTRYMLKYRARSQALKDIAPDALNGLGIAEYDFNVRPDVNGNYDERDVGNAAMELELETK